MVVLLWRAGSKMVLTLSIRWKLMASLTKENVAPQAQIPHLKDFAG